MKKLTAVCIVLLICLELAVRASGLTDFPIYAVDNDIGYMLKPSQQGSFLHTHSWVYNDRSMGVSRAWNSAQHPNILLLGNSIVSGGNPFDQKEKLGPLIQKNLGENYAVWPISAGGWTNVNEVVYLHRNPDIAASPNFFIWEFMSGGLSGLSVWRGEYVFPSEQPLLASWYAFRRYVMPHLYAVNMNDLPPTGTLNPEHLAAFENTIGDLSRATKSDKPGILFFYPKKAEYLSASHGAEWLPERADIERIARANHLTVVDISRQPEWNANLYRPDGVHPTAQGNIVLARILTTATKASLH